MCVYVYVCVYVCVCVSISDLIRDGGGEEEEGKKGRTGSAWRNIEANN